VRFTLIEMYLVCGVGLVMLGFTGLSMTTSSGEKFLGYVLSIGVKLMIIYAIAGLGGNLAAQSIALFGSMSTPYWTDLIAVAPTFLIFGAVALMVPGLAASLMNGSPGMSAGNFAGASLGIVAGAAGAAAVATGAARVAGNATPGLNKLGQATNAGITGRDGGTPSMAGLASLGGGNNAASATRSGGSGGGPSAGTSTAMAAGSSSTFSSGAGSSAASGFRPSAAGVGASSVPSSTPSAIPSSLPSANSGADAALAKSTSADVNSISGAPASTGTTPSGSGEPASKFDDGYLKKGINHLTGMKDALARHEGGGGGISIRFNHNDT
jgi:type IV secretion system protein TrbL